METAITHRLSEDEVVDNQIEAFLSNSKSRWSRTACCALQISVQVRASREKVREAIRSGRLPSRSQDSTRGSSGSGGVCRVCQEVIVMSSSMTELEVAFNDRAAGFVVCQIHYQCFAAWEIERTTTDQ